MVKLTTEKFIEKARAIHGDKYDYSDVRYWDESTKILISPSKNNHAYSGSSFWRYPKDHLCGDGYRIRQKEKNTTEQFIEKAKKVHGDKFDYSKVEYKGSFEKVCIICKEHGEFWQVASTHINSPGYRCEKCNPVLKYKNMGIKGSSAIHRYKLKNDKSYRVKSLLRTRFGSWLKAKKAPKEGSITAKIQEYIMMERVSFIAHYESLFYKPPYRPMMTWENTHIDHHIPLSHFDPTNEEDNKIAWNWYNLRPLIAEDNFSKNNKLPKDYEDVLATIKYIIANNITDPNELKKEESLCQIN